MFDPKLDSDEAILAAARKQGRTAGAVAMDRLVAKLEEALRDMHTQVEGREDDYSVMLDSFEKGMAEMKKQSMVNGGRHSKTVHVAEMSEDEDEDPLDNNTTRMSTDVNANVGGGFDKLTLIFSNNEYNVAFVVPVENNQRRMCCVFTARYSKRETFVAHKDEGFVTLNAMFRNLIADKDPSYNKDGEVTHFTLKYPPIKPDLEL